MQLKSLQAFLAVAEHASFAQAAAHLYTVQSNISAHIQKLEAELGVMLFERSSKVHLTSAGRELKPFAQNMLRSHAQALALFQGRQAPAGRLHIGAMETTAAIRLPTLLSAYHARYPEVELQLTTGPTAQLAHALQQGQLDCAFVAGSLPAPGLVQRPVFAEELVLLSAKPLTALPDATALLNSTFLVFRQGCSYRQRVELLLSEQGVTAVRMMEFASLEALLGCVAAGMGYALLPRAVAEQARPLAVQALSLPQHVAHAPTYLAAGDASGHSPALRAFIDSITAPLGW